MVVFGWNGTIVVDADRMRAALNVVLRGRGMPQVGEAEFAARFKLPMARVFADLGVPDADAAGAEAEWSDELGRTQAHLRDGAADALIDLSSAGCWLGVVSSASAAAIRYDQRTLQVPSVFNSITPSVADRYATLMSLRPQRPEAVFVGDTTDEMRSASAAGFATVGIAADDASGDALRHAGAATVVSGLSGLIPLVERLAVAAV
jgi:phosphoglycolate phosphatase